MGFFSSGKTAAPTFGFNEYWTPERLKGGIGEFGQVYKPEALDPIWNRAQGQASEKISGEYASRGFGALRTGPAAYRASESARQMGESRAADEQERLMEFLKMKMAGSNPHQYTQQKTPSGFSALTGPLLGAAGTALGGPLAGAAMSGFGSLFSGGTAQPQMPRDFRSGASYQ